MAKSFKILFNSIPDGWKFFGAITGFSVVIWQAAIMFDHWQDKGITQDSSINHLKTFETDQKLYNKIRDSIELVRWNRLELKLKHISDSIRLSFLNQQKLTNTVGTMATNMTKTVPDLFKLMGGLQFELIYPESMKSFFPDTKIRITKDTTKKK